MKHLKFVIPTAIIAFGAGVQAGQCHVRSKVEKKLEEAKAFSKISFAQEAVNAWLLDDNDTRTFEEFVMDITPQVPQHTNN